MLNFRQSYYVFPPVTMYARLSLLLTSVFLFTIIAPSAHAIVDSDAFIKELEQILSRGSSGENVDDDLAKLLEDLDMAAEGDADQYLQFTKDAKTVTFWDVAKTTWFYPHVLTLVELGIVSGKEDSQGNITGYDPAGNVSRPAAVKMAVLAAGIDTSTCGTPVRSDALGHWAEAYIACGEKQGMQIGGLTGQASRAEILHYLSSAFAVSVPEGSAPFADSRDHEYEGEIAYAYALGIISGDTNQDGSEKGTFRPNDGVNRAETAKMVKLAIELL